MLSEKAALYQLLKEMEGVSADKKYCFSFSFVASNQKSSVGRT